MKKLFFLSLVLIAFSAHAWLSEPSLEMQRAVRPYLLPEDHPAAGILDELFAATRVTAKLNSLKQAGFYNVDLRKRGIVFARHPKLPGYVLKMVLDYTGHSNDKWIGSFRLQDEYVEFTGRIKKRNEIQQHIDDYNLKAFITPKKWIYPIPTHINPPKNHKMIKKFYILIAEDMDIEPFTITAKLWKTAFNKEMVDDYFFIATSLKLRDLGPPNQSFTKSGFLAFIDTKDWPEELWNNLKRVPKFLSKEMGEYWKTLLENGLPEDKYSQ